MWTPNSDIQIPPLGEIPESVWLWLAKGAGAVFGSVISLAYVLPRGRREAAVRFLVGVLIGVTFGSLAGAEVIRYLGLTDELTRFEIVLMGSTAASLCAWWALGLLRRLMDRPMEADRHTRDKE